MLRLARILTLNWFGIAWLKKLGLKGYALVVLAALVFTNLIDPPNDSIRQGAEEPKNRESASDTRNDGIVDAGISSGVEHDPIIRYEYLSARTGDLERWWVRGVSQPQGELADKLTTDGINPEEVYVYCSGEFGPIYAEIHGLVYFLNGKSIRPQAVAIRRSGRSDFPLDPRDDPRLVGNTRALIASNSCR